MSLNDSLGGTLRWLPNLGSDDRGKAFVLEKRFTMQDDGKGLWSIVDGESGSSATVQNRELINLDETGARDAADLLNMIVELRAQKPEQSVGLHSGPQSFLAPIR